MKNQYIVFCLSFLFFGCAGEPSQTENETIVDKVESSEITADHAIFEDVELSAEENEIINELKGNFYKLEANEQTYAYKEPSEFGTFGFQVLRKLDDINFWEIVWMNRAIPIHKVEKTDQEIVLYGFDDEEISFYIKEDPETKVVTVNVGGYPDDFYYTRAENIQVFKAVACVNRDAFLRKMPTAWYGFTEVDGQDVLYQPCEEAPVGLTINSQTIDFWSGTDPYPIIEISKLFDKLSIVYQTSMSADTLVMQYQSNNAFKIGDGTPKDPLFISAIAMDNYTIVKEDCH